MLHEIPLNIGHPADSPLIQKNIKKTYVINEAKAKEMVKAFVDEFLKCIEKIPSVKNSITPEIRLKELIILEKFFKSVNKDEHTWMLLDGTEVSGTSEEELRLVSTKSNLIMKREYAPLQIKDIKGQKKVCKI